MKLKVRILILIVLVAFLAAGAFPHPVSAQDKTETYGMVVFLKGSEFFNWAYAGMVDAAKQLGPNVKVQLLGPAEWDASLEAREIENLVARGVDGILATAGDAQAMNSAIDKAVAAKIPVVLFDSDAPDSKRLAFVGTNNYNAGCEAGKAVAKWRGNDAVVGISTFPGPDHLARRVQGFKDCLAAAAPKATIAQTANDQGKPETAEAAVTAMLQANPTINVVFGAHGNPGPGAASAVRTLKLQGKVDILAFDFGTPVLELIKKGEIKATVVQNPYLMGYMSLMVAYGARHPTETSKSYGPIFNGFGPYPSFGIDTGVGIAGANDIAPYLNPPKF
jgi:ribose transport system substrate-binding protein